MRATMSALAMSMALMASAMAAEPLTCTTGELFAGAPDYPNPTDRPKDGQGLLDVPPVLFRGLVFSGNRLITTVGPELWVADLAAESPTLTRLAGRESSKREARPGACKDARFGSISGIAMLPDGRLAGADQMANLLFVVNDPFGPDCAVTFIAGATAPQSSLNPGYPENAGDADGPGPTALLSGPDWVATLDDGVVYFIDTGNGKLKRVLADADHTVETVGVLPEGVYYALIALEGKLYGLANTETSEGFILEIDPTTGAMRDVLRGRSDIWLSYGSINISGLATDGNGLITSQSGQILYVTREGSISSIAGKGTYSDFEPGYDVRQPHSAADLQILTRRRVMTAGANVFLTYHNGNLYVSALGNTPYVLRIACP